MKVLALCTGLVLLAIAADLGRGGAELPPKPDAGLWLRLLVSLPAATSESLLAARGEPAEVHR